MEESQNSSAPFSFTELPQLTPESASYLLNAAKWGKFLAILGFIVSGLLITGGLIMSFVLHSVSDEMVPLNLPFPAVLLSIMYIAIAVIYLIPVLFLNSFSNKAIKAVNLGSTENMTTSLKNLKNLFVFIGISTIAIIALYTLILIVIGSTAALSF